MPSYTQCADSRHRSHMTHRETKSLGICDQFRLDISVSFSSWNRSNLWYFAAYDLLTINDSVITIFVFYNSNSRPNQGIHLHRDRIWCAISVSSSTETSRQPQTRSIHRDFSDLDGSRTSSRVFVCFCSVDRRTRIFEEALNLGHYLKILAKHWKLLAKSEGLNISLQHQGKPWWTGRSCSNAQARRPSKSGWRDDRLVLARSQ
jgi:hypothetical protein